VSETVRLLKPARIAVHNLCMQFQCDILNFEVIRIMKSPPKVHEKNKYKINYENEIDFCASHTLVTSLLENY